jgi:hypothetical protein
MQGTMVIIDATGEGMADSPPDTALQEVIARQLDLPVEAVRAQWMAVSLVGGMEGASPEMVRREVGVLETLVPQLAGAQPVIIFQEYPEEAEALPVSANCAFACRVQSLTGREPHIIGVVQTREEQHGSRGYIEDRLPHIAGVVLTGAGRGWKVDYSFPPEGRAA